MLECLDGDNEENCIARERDRKTSKKMYKVALIESLEYI